MIAAPWYLLSAGIILLIVGYLLAGIRKPSRRDRPIIDPRMRDDEIVRNLQASQGIALENLVVLAGWLLILVSVAWRLLRLLSKWT